MILLALNFRGVEGSPKQQALKGPMAMHNLVVLFIQESTCAGSKVVEIVSSCLKDWDFYSMASEGLSRSLVITWNKKIDIISTKIIP
jgi:hypothetical protein